MMDIDHARSCFIKHFDDKAENIYFSPGRINLVGKHTDYNGGFVFPGTVDKRIMAEVRSDGTNTVICYIIDTKDRVEFKVDDPEGPCTSWAHYIYGMVQEMKRLDVGVKGFNTAFSGDVSLGASMFSSAALESCLTFALNGLFGDNRVSKWDMTLAGQATEYKYVDVNYSIMDQFVSTSGQEDRLVRLDYRSREFKYFPLSPESYRLMLVNSCMRHGPVGSLCNDRRKSCENVIKHIVAKYPNKKFEALHDCIQEQLETVRAGVGKKDYNRARFVLGEEDRVLAVCDALEIDDYETVGKEIYETRKGLNKDHEISCEELGFLNDIVKENGVTGSCIIGSGFGGCTISPVKDEVHNKFVTGVTGKYLAKFNKKPEIYDIVTSQGSHKVC